MEALVDRHLPDAYLAHLNDHKISTLNPELQFSPNLAKLFLQENNSLTMLPPSLFQHMPVLRVLDLSHTSIQSLPPSISKLCSLEEFILRECSLLTELPPEIGALKNLKLFDLEGTEIMYLPKEIGALKTLERLRFSLSTYADDHKERNGIRHIIPRMTILKLTKLKELSISVSPEAEWWEVELLEAIMGDLPFLSDLKILKLYLPTAKALQRFLRLERYKVPIYSSLSNYRLMTGHCEELPFSVQLDSEANFLKLEKCVKYMNGERYTDVETADLVRDARALYLRRHWTIEKLSMFDIRRLKYCLLMECNEMQTVVDQDDVSKHETKPTSHGEGEILGSLQYLSIHFLKNLQRISKGPIGRNSLSCLRILALHTCPELTTIFTECLLENLQSLNEIIVEDCPKVNCLVNLEEGALTGNGPFLPNVRMISLLDLPELVSVSGGVCIAPQLESLLVFNCMKLDYLSDMEIPRDTMAVKGEIEWWDALKSGKSTWESVFIQLKRDGSLMDQLAEDTNSLQHFLELKMDPSLPGLVNQNSSPDTKEDREHVDQLQIVHNVDLSNKTPNDTRKYVQNGSLNFEIKRKYSNITSRHEVKVTVNKGTEIKKALEDGYDWRKYGQKDILGSKYSRSYYRCSFRYNGCCATKQVQRSDEDPSVFEIWYRGKHSCSTVLSNDFSSTATKSACTTLIPRGSLAATESVSTITESLSDLANSPQVLDCNKIKSISTRDHKWTKLQIVSPNIDFDVPPDDAYIWSKHGQHDILGATYPSLPERNSCETESALSISGSSITVESELRVLENSGSSTTAESIPTVTDNSFRLNFTKKMSGSGSIQKWKQQAEEIHSPSLKFQLPSSYEPNVIRSEVAVNCSRNLSSSTKTHQNAKQCPSPVLKGSPGSISSLKSQQQAAGNNQIYDTSHLNESANEPLSGTYSSYYALPTESIFPERPGQPDCQYYMKTGDCKFGATCKFNHPRERVIPPPDCALSLVGLPIRPARKEKLADRITELHQLVSPFGKTDATSVLSETCGYIKFLHE